MPARIEQANEIMQILKWRTFTNYDCSEFPVVFEKFAIDSLKSLQREALEKLASGEDMFVTQSASPGKSLIFYSVPIAFDALKPQKNCEYLNVINPLVFHLQFPKITVECSIILCDGKY